MCVCVASTTPFPFFLFFVRAVCVRACQPRHPFTVKRIGFPTYVRSLRVVTHLRYFRTSVPYLLPPLRPAIFFFFFCFFSVFEKPGVSNLCCSCDKLNAREREEKNELNGEKRNNKTTDFLKGENWDCRHFQNWKKKVQWKQQITTFFEIRYGLPCFKSLNQCLIIYRM